MRNVGVSVGDSDGASVGCSVGTADGLGEGECVVGTSVGVQVSSFSTTRLSFVAAF